MRIDLNADVGEGAGQDQRILEFVTSANIACGGHAGDDATMAETVRLCLLKGVRLGAHPGYEDKADFGRTERSLPAAEIKGLVVRQVQRLRAIAARAGTAVRHVKPHGALYNQAAKDPAIATAVAEAVAGVDARLILYGLAGSELVVAGERAGLAVANEVFADRRYLADGTLVPRSRGPEALIADEAEAVAQVLQMVREGTVTAITGEKVPVRAHTVCIHGDSPHGARLSEKLRAALE